MGYLKANTRSVMINLNVFEYCLAVLGYVLPFLLCFNFFVVSLVCPWAPGPEKSIVTDGERTSCERIIYSYIT